jgi:hypothetical protein
MFDTLLPNCRKFETRIPGLGKPSDDAEGIDLYET